MYLRELSLTQFKNYRSASFQFSASLNFFTGENGSGKTNVLDAIHYLCLGKSYFHGTDQQSILQNENFFRLKGNFINEEQHEVGCVFQQGGKKELSKNGITYSRITDHVGIIPVVMIAPDDHSLIDEGSDERRRFIDNTISQIDHNYLEDLVNYNRVLQQRNASLKKFAEQRTFNAALIETLNEQLVSFGKKIFVKRELFLKKMLPLIEKYYATISGGKEKVNAKFASVFHEGDFLSTLEKSIDKDRMLQRTTEGIHRDEFEFFLGESSMKKSGSQGQKKSFLMSLKLAQYELIKQEKEKSPILLLDDLFDKLDGSRSQNLLHLLTDDGFGQVFITDTNQIRIQEFISASKKTVTCFEISNGNAAQRQ